jgi:hypothetical protein
MSPSGALVLTAHADARIRIANLPNPGMPEEPVREVQGVTGEAAAGGGAHQKSAQVLA